MNDLRLTFVKKVLTEEDFSAFLEKNPRLNVNTPVEFIKTIREINSNIGLKDAFLTAKKVFPELFCLVNVKQDDWSSIVKSVRRTLFSAEEKENLINAVRLVWGQTRSEEIKFHL